MTAMCCSICSSSGNSRSTHNSIYDHDIDHDDDDLSRKLPTVETHQPKNSNCNPTSTTICNGVVAKRISLSSSTSSWSLMSLAYTMLLLFLLVLMNDDTTAFIQHINGFSIPNTAGSTIIRFHPKQQQQQQKHHQEERRRIGDSQYFKSLLARRCLTSTTQQYYQKQHQRRLKQFFLAATEGNNDNDDKSYSSIDEKKVSTTSSTTFTSTTTISTTATTTSTTATTTKEMQFNWERINTQIKLLFQMSLPYYQESIPARWLLGGVLVLTLANSGISVLFSYTSKDFWNALSTKDTTEYYIVLQKYIVALAIGAPIATLYKYQREQLSIHWREWMTDRTYSLYSTNQVYYRLERYPTTTTSTSTSTGLDGTMASIGIAATTSSSLLQHTIDENDDKYNISPTIDNPDQRITEDVKTFTSFSLQLIITLLTSIIDLVSFSAILWSIYPQLFVAVIVYAAIGTFVTALLGKSLIALNFQQLKYEADLRYVLVRIRDNAESIAFYSGEEIEGRAVTQRTQSVMNNRRTINTVQRNLEFFTNSYRYFIQILPIAVVAPKYFASEIGLGIISQSAGAFNHILSDLSILINQFEQLSAFSAGIERLSDFYNAMKHADIDRVNTNIPLLQQYNSSTNIHINDNDNNYVATTTTTTLTSAGDSYINKDQNIIKSSELEPLLKTSTNSSNHSNGQKYYNGRQDKEQPWGTTNDYTSVSDASNATITTTTSIGQITLQRWKPLAVDEQLHDTVLMIQNMDLYTPDRKRKLIQNLSLTLNVGENLLIVGNSGTGKSSLLRAIAGLWTTGNGCIVRPADVDVYFLPQRPYCTIGTLKDQLLYPSIEGTSSSSASTITTNTNVNTSTTSKSNTNKKDTIVSKSHILKQTLTDDDLLDILVQVDLLDVAIRSGDGNPYKGLYSIQDWSNQLSLGEQQRLAFGRLLVNRPALIILDEATSALDIANEARMYTLLKNMAQKTFVNGTMSAPGVTYISVGHRPSLVAFHDTKLRLGNNGDNQQHELISVEKSFPNLQVLERSIL